jgi:hypothetical protein
VGSPKGGVGKSAAAWEIAQGYARAGAKTCLIDGDETATLATKYDNRQSGPNKDNPGATVVIAPEQIERTVRDMAKVMDLVVVDLGARDWSRYATLPMVSDLWLLPTDFSTDNMVPAARLFADTLWPLRGRHVRGGAVPVRLLWSQTPTHKAQNANCLARSLAWWKQTIETITQLKPSKGKLFHTDTGFDVIKAQLRLRTSPWDEAVNRGASMSELPNAIAGRAAAEVEELLAEVQRALQ